MKGWKAVLAVIVPAMIAGGLTWQMSSGQEAGPPVEIGEVLKLLSQVEAALVPYLKKENGEPNMRAEFAMVAIADVRLAVTRYQANPTEDNGNRLDAALLHMSTQIDRAKQDR